MTETDLGVAAKPLRVRARVEPGVDGRAAAEHARAHVRDAVLRRERLRWRVGLRGRVRHGERPHEPARRGERGELAGRAAALEQEHPPAAGPRQRRGERAARRAAAHDDVVVQLHRRRRRRIDHVPRVRRRRPCENRTTPDPPHRHRSDAADGLRRLHYRDLQIGCPVVPPKARD